MAMSTQKRSIGLFGAISIGVGGMVGGGIFAVLGEAVSLAHGATAIAFLVAGTVALFTSYSYAKLSVAYKNRGGTVVFIDKAFEHNTLSGTVNLMLWLSYLVTISLYAVAFSSYAQTFFPSPASPLLHHGLISAAIVLPALVNLISASFVSKSETLIVVIKIILLLVIIVSSVSYVDMERVSAENWGSFGSVVVAGMVIFVAYEGFELIANAAEDVKNPAVVLPRAFYGSVLLVIVLYALIAIITVGTVPENELLAASDYALAVAAKPALGSVGFTMVAVAALLATFSAINATIYGNSRLGYILAKEGELPGILEKEERSIPTNGVLLTTLLSLVLANSIDLTEIAIIGSASFLLIFFIVNLASLKLYKSIEANRFVVMMAALMSLAALATLLFHTFFTSPGAIGVFLSFICVAFVFEQSYGRYVRGHLFYRPY